MFHQRYAFVSLAIFLWSIGECRCQGYPSISAQGTIDGDSFNLGQIQWGTLPGHAHITGAFLIVDSRQCFYDRRF